MAFFNLRTVQAREPARHKKRDYYKPGYRNPLHTDERDAAAPKIAGRLALFAAMCAGFIAVLYWILFSGSFSVRSIDVEGAGRTSADDIKRVAESALHRRRFLILNQQQSLFAVDSMRVRAQLVDAFALVHATVTPQLPHTLRISIQERTPVYEVRGSNGGEALIDTEGVIIAAAAGNEQPAHDLFTLKVSSLASTTTGERLFDRSAMVFLNDARDNFAFITQGYRIVSLNLERVLVHDIVAETSEPWVIYMTDELIRSCSSST